MRRAPISAGGAPSGRWEVRREWTAHRGTLRPVVLGAWVLGRSSQHAVARREAGHEQPASGTGADCHPDVGVALRARRDSHHPIADVTSRRGADANGDGGRDDSARGRGEGRQGPADSAPCGPRGPRVRGRYARAGNDGRCARQAAQGGGGVMTVLLSMLLIAACVALVALYAFLWHARYWRDYWSRRHDGMARELGEALSLADDKGTEAFQARAKLAGVEGALKRLWPHIQVPTSFEATAVSDLRAAFPSLPVPGPTVGNSDARPTCPKCKASTCVAPGHCDDPGYFFGGIGR
ncbi:hypothetical protein Mx9_p61 [Myxococcus phage Mx9]|nr:hypothetical protein Mx9_p61 [Myxococcus phage Mx9]